MLSLTLSVSFSKLEMHWMVLLDMTATVCFGTQYDMSALTQWEIPSHPPIAVHTFQAPCWSCSPCITHGHRSQDQDTQICLLFHLLHVLKGMFLVILLLVGKCAASPVYFIELHSPKFSLDSLPYHRPELSLPDFPNYSFWCWILIWLFQFGSMDFDVVSA